MSILYMILTEFWPFVAACFLLGVIFNGTAAVVREFRSKRGGE